ncbi:MAG: iron-containing alcohol dehydrogenase [Spirochaetales bacterium]|uniref:Iron-containing alcohol dehydrogenase n=1 Tax=Candidatus Thalassospirochaeta sargassi TaxID=3119039 RepID=A0AAJ1MM92_9SPIO|nr:iron-containing alcohol dehydrogenase [Spirochaetales bacterium]
MQQVVFDIPVKACMGFDSFGRLGEAAAECGKRALIVTGTAVSDTGLTGRVESILESRGISSIVFNSIGPDTTSEVIDAAAGLASAGKAQMIIGLGGVKTLSIARAAALIAPSELRVDDYIDGMQPDKKPLPFLSLPTACRDPFMFKDSIMITDGRNSRCSLMSTAGVYPEAVFIDPETAVTIPAATFSFTIMDTLMYAIEGYISEKSNFLSENLFLKAISAVVTSERRLDENLTDREAYIKAARAGLVTAMGLSMAGPGLGAALSMIISSQFRVPRVLVSAVVLPIVLEYGVKVCPEKIARLAPILNESTDGISAVDAAERVIETIRHRIGLKRVQMRLSEFGVGLDDLGGIAANVRKFDFITQLPAPVSTDELTTMLRKTL